MLDLVAYEEAVAFLGGDKTAQPDNLKAWISGISVFIRRHIANPIEITEFTETIDGSGESMLRLPQRPVVSVSALSIDGVEADMSGLVIYPDEIYRPEGFPVGHGNVSVTWKAGIGDQIPADLKLAVLLIVEKAAKLSLLNQADHGEYAYVFTPSKWPADAREIVASYRRKL
jgi:hypothetical protein